MYTVLLRHGVHVEGEAAGVNRDSDSHSAEKTKHNTDILVAKNGSSSGHRLMNNHIRELTAVVGSKEETYVGICGAADVYVQLPYDNTWCYPA